MNEKGKRARFTVFCDITTNECTCVITDLKKKAKRPKNHFRVGPPFEDFINEATLEAMRRKCIVVDERVA